MVGKPGSTIDIASRALHTVIGNGRCIKLKHYCRAAKLFRALNDLDAAERCLNEAKRRHPTSSIIWSLLGEIWRDRGNADDAEQCFNTALAIASSLKERLMALHGLAGCFTDTARGDAARDVHESMMKIGPHHALSYYYFALSQQGDAMSAEFTGRLAAMLKSPEFGKSDRMHLHYALGMVLDRRGQYGDAFAHFMVANAIQAKQAHPSEFDEGLIRKRVDERIQVFSREWMADISRHGDPDDFLVCIVGMPRSGTTLIEQILCSHPSVVVLGERMDFQLLTRRLGACLRSRRPYPLCCSAMSPTDVRELSASVRERLCRSAGPGSRVVTKLPDDAWEVGLIKILFPNARIIHSRRHPIDTCLSCFMQNFSDLKYTTDLSTLAYTYRAYRRVMRHWSDVLGDGQIFECAYEDLVSDPEVVVRALHDFCGLPYNESWSMFWNHARRVDTASMWQVRRPIYQTSVQKWNKYAMFLGPLLNLGEDL